MQQTTQRANRLRYRLWLLSGAIGYYLSSGTSPRAADAVVGIWALAGAGLLIARVRRRGGRFGVRCVSVGVVGRRAQRSSP